MKNSILVTGAAGYIGSHMLLALQASGLTCVAMDNLTTGHRDLIPPDVPFVQADIRDRAELESIFASFRPHAVIHFAASAYVGESVQNPRKYYENNVTGTISLLGAAIDHGVENLVFSSSCATYGQPEQTPITEETPQLPINPYGRSKLMIERVLSDYGSAFGLRSVMLRYFNVVGADEKLRTGERHNPETHVIPLILETAAGRRKSFTVYGTDYPTPDGTCIRDYVHVSDLVDAHVLSLDYLLSGGESRSFNVGTERGVSIRQLLEAAKRVTGTELAVQWGERRPGDPAELVADAARIRAELHWHPRFTDIEGTIASAWRWHRKDWASASR